MQKGKDCHEHNHSSQRYDTYVRKFVTKMRHKPKSIAKSNNYTSTIMDEGDKTGLNCTQEPSISNSVKEDSGDGDGLGDTCFSRNKQYHHAPNSPDNPSHHAPIPPSLNPMPSGSIPMPPGDLSPSPACRIVTETPSLPLKLARKPCNTVLSSLVYTSPSSPCATWNILLWTENRLEESVEEPGMMEESLLLMGERGGRLGVAGLCLEPGRGMGISIDKDGGVEEEWTPGRGSTSPLQDQQRES